MTHTEKVHVIFGLLAAVTGAFALWAAYRPASVARLVWPILAFLIGFFLFIPVEAQTRTYQEVGWWGTLLSFVPEHALSWFSNWFRYLTHWHVIEHKVGGLLIMVAGVIEFQRGRGRLTHQRWGVALPALLLAIGIAFGVHGGTAEHLPHRIEQIQHWVFGLAFVAAAVALAWARRDGPRRREAWQGLWAALVIIVGVDFALFYRLPPADRGGEVHHHEGSGTGMR